MAPNHGVSLVAAMLGMPQQFGVTRRVVSAPPPAFTPQSLFGAGEPGVWYDIDDLSTLCQTWDGTSGNVSVDDPVGRVDDKSGYGQHFIQATSGSRPLLKQDANGKHYLLFDGANDSMSTVAAVDLSAVRKLTVCVGIRKLSDAAIGLVVESSSNFGSNSGSFVIYTPDNGSANTLLFGSKGSAANSRVYTGLAAPASMVVTGTSDISVPTIGLRVNGVAMASHGGSQGTGNFGNHTLFIGRRNNSSLPFGGWLYGMVVRGAASSEGEIDDLEDWMNQRVGAY